MIAVILWVMSLIMIGQTTTVTNDGQCVRTETTYCESDFTGCFTVVSVECAR